MNQIKRHRLTFILCLCLLTPACASGSPVESRVNATENVMLTDQPTATMPHLQTTPTYQLASKTCDESECLFKSDGKDATLLGVASIAGYYKNLPVTLDNMQTINCNYLVMTGGSLALEQWFRSMIDFGNTVNRKNELNQVVVGINLRPVNAVTREMIFASSAEHPVTLTVVSPMPPASFGACLSFVRILTAN